MNKEIENLKARFDKVYIKHTKTESGLGGETSVHLVLGDDVYIGTAKCHSEDQFNKRLGREIAIGRAVHAFDVASSKKEPRVLDGKFSYSAIGYKVRSSTESGRHPVIIVSYV